MRYFFVDTENVNNYSFIEKMSVSSEDTIILFFSEKSKGIKVEDLKKITESLVNVQYEKVDTNTKNALSYQLLISLLLKIKAMCDGDEFFVVTNNDDYNSALEYIESKIGEKVSVVQLEDEEIKECRAVVNNDLSALCIENLDF